MTDPKAVIIDVSDANFREAVVERSFSVPVLVDFWAPWCGPCKSLTPVLESVTQRMKGRFLLAKLNTDENPQISRQLGVQGLPTVKAFVDGKIVDGFTGVLPEDDFIRFVDKVAPSHTEKFFEKLVALRQAGQIQVAVNGLCQLLEQEPGHIPARLELAGILLDGNQLEEARGLMAPLMDDPAPSTEVMAVLSRIRFLDEAEPVEPLRAALAEDPSNQEAMVALGKALLAKGGYEEGFDLLLDSIRLAGGDDEMPGRDVMIRAFEVLGNSDPRVLKYRSQLSMLLYK